VGKYSKRNIETHVPSEQGGFIQTQDIRFPRQRVHEFLGEGLAHDRSGDALPKERPNVAGNLDRFRPGKIHRVAIDIDHEQPTPVSVPLADVAQVADLTPGPIGRRCQAAASVPGRFLAQRAALPILVIGWETDAEPSPGAVIRINITEISSRQKMGLLPA
jgi:hypothetical protein